MYDMYVLRVRYIHDMYVSYVCIERYEIYMTCMYHMHVLRDAYIIQHSTTTNTVASARGERREREREREREERGEREERERERAPRVRARGGVGV